MALKTSMVILLLLTLAFNAHGEPIKIGVIAPLTGTFSSLGETLKNSVVLAQRHFDADHHIEFLFEDDGFVIKNTASAAQKLIEIDHVAALIVFGSGTGMAAAEIAERNKIPMIGLGLSDRITKGRSYVFRYFLEVEELTKLIAQEVKRRGYKSVAVITTEQDGMNALRDLFIAANPTQIVFNENILPGDTDLRAVASRIKAANPDAIYLALLSPQPAAFGKQIRALNYKGDFFSGPQFQFKSEIKTAGGALEGSWFVTADERNAANFYKAYKESLA